MRALAYANAARFRQTLQTRRYVDAIPENIAIVDDDVADVYADAKCNTLVCRNAGIAFGHLALNVDRAAHGVDNTAKLDQQTIAGGLNDTAVIFGDLRIHERAPMPL